MEFKFNLTPQIFFGKDSFKKNSFVLLELGKRVFIATGKKSGVESGAIADIIAFCKTNFIEYYIFNEIENNPSLENIEKASKVCREFNADYIIGVGGGSPLDASKAIAVLATNEIEPIKLFENNFKNKPLKIISIPTTSGTGSEITPYSIITRHDMQTKMSFASMDIFPKYSFNDPNYTMNLSYELTVSTAIDALTHALEGYISKRNVEIADIFAIEAFKNFGECIEALVDNSITYDIREKLMYISMLGGMVISHTGTTIMHGLGYSLTYYKGIQHGTANGIFFKEYLNMNYEFAKDKIDNFIKLLKLKSIDEFGEIIYKLIGNIEINEEEFKKIVDISMTQKSLAYNIKKLDRNDIENIVRKSLAIRG